MKCVIKITFRNLQSKRQMKKQNKQMSRSGESWEEKSRAEKGFLISLRLPIWNRPVCSSLRRPLIGLRSARARLALALRWPHLETVAHRGRRLTVRAPREEMRGWGWEEEAKTRRERERCFGLLLDSFYQSLSRALDARGKLGLQRRSVCLLLTHSHSRICVIIYHNFTIW